MTGITSHELFEAVTDPYLMTAPAYRSLSDTLQGSGYQEIGDLCEGRAEVVPSDLGYPVQPIWSNSASAAAHDPCQPGGASPYFYTAPDVTDAFSYGMGSTRGLKLAPGATATIDLVAFSDADTGGPWTLSITRSWQTAADKMSITICRTSAQNGERVPMTITRPSTSTVTDMVRIDSTLGNVTSSWAFLVGD